MTRLPKSPMRFCLRPFAGARARLRAGVACLLLAGLGLAGCAPASPPPAAEPARVQAAPPCYDRPGTSLFEFHSAFWLNLHNFLFREAKQRRGIRDDGLGALGDVDAESLLERPLTADESRRWERAVQFYAATVLSTAKPDSVVIRVNNRLALSDSLPELGGFAGDSAFRAVLLDVAPVYRAVWWPRHDRHNRLWIAEAREWLARHGACLAPRLAAALRADWPAEPIRVDATVYASWFGAYTTLGPPHITVSSTARASRGASGLETLLHEAGHALLAPLDSALAGEGARLERAVPAELSHLVLFYTAGDLVRRAVPEHPTNAELFRIWAQNRRSRAFRGLIEREWSPYLRGERSFRDGVQRLAGAAARNG